ncbi:MAG: hypothetical protein U0R51_10690 [Solirubrobacterales bacterium]
MKRASILLTVIAALALLSFSIAACGGGDDTGTAPEVTSLESSTTEIDPADIQPYPEAVKAEFLKSCGKSSGGEKSLCECILTAYEETLPLEMYQKVTDPKPGQAPPAVPQATQDAANACVSNG